LSVTASGGKDSDYTYQWQYCDTEEGTYNSVTPESDGKSASYTPAEELTADRYYRCVVTNYCGVKESDTVKVTVREELKAMISGGTGQIICFNTKPNELSVTASGGKDSDYTYQWQYCDIEEGTYTDITPESDGKLDSYTPAELTANRYYRCVVTNACGKVWSDTVTIAVLGVNGIVYVKETATGLGDGSSWTNAYGGLADPLIVAAQSNNCIREIWVAKGTYYPKYKAGGGTDDRDKAFVLVAGVKIYGGFAGDEDKLTDRITTTENRIVEMVNETTLSGYIGNLNSTTDSCYHVVIGAGKSTLEMSVDGFTITGGNANASGDISVNGITDINRNSGGGIVNYYSKLALTNVKITGNTASSHGGGIYNYFDSQDASPTLLTNVQITGNTSGSDGGGIYNYNNSLTLTNVQITGNTARSYGGGICNSNDENNPIRTLTLTNVQITGNTTSGDNGGGIYNGLGYTTILTNVTVAGNYAKLSGGGIYFATHTENGSSQIHNSIIYGNSSETAKNVYADISLSQYFTYTNSLVDGVNNTGIQTSDPMFVRLDSAKSVTDRKLGGDYRLQPFSPAIDAGDNSVYLTARNINNFDGEKDLAGSPRLLNDIIDVGAYESPIQPVVAVNDTVITTVFTTIKIDVLANDDFNECSGTPVISDISAEYGNVSLVATNDTLIYTPTCSGIDSIDYTVKCGGSSASARVYVLTLEPLSNQYSACIGTETKMAFTTIEDVHYEWYNANMDAIPSSSNTDTVTVIKNADDTEIYYARPVWKDMVFPLYKVELHLSDNSKPPVSDIRVLLSPKPERTVYLTSFVDSLNTNNIIQWSRSNAAASTLYDASSGELHTAEFPSYGTYTYIYTRFSECSSFSTAKAYIHIVHDKIPARPDTVLICRTQDSVINVNSILGLEFGGSWYYGNSIDHPNMNPDNKVELNTKKIDPPSKFAGAIIFNADQAFEAVKNDDDYNGSYKGVTGKKFVFEYDYSNNNYINGTMKTKKIVIVVYN
jgi:predicted outer membrane repeat protein